MKKLFLLAWMLGTFSPIAFCGAGLTFYDATKPPIALTSTGTVASEEKMACIDGSEGDACEFENREGDTINGKCRYESGVEGPLTCVPYQ